MKKEAITEICVRCNHECPISEMRYTEDAYWCHDCNDVHDGWVCAECLDLETKHT